MAYHGSAPVGHIENNYSPRGAEMAMRKKITDCCRFKDAR
jgi:hypothetical protein